jgi:5-methylcytosine-specific restriction endonuclease McrBC regulatory subunit McrC
MELVRHTVEYIKQKPYGNTMLIKAKEEVKLVVEATSNYKYYDRRKIIDANKKSPIRHAYYHEYNDLQRLCLMILQHQKHQIGLGTHQIYGILFDGSWLWEEYVNLVLKEGEVRFFHPENRVKTGKQFLFSSDKGKEGEVYPDFISYDANNRIIADAKYKPINNIRGDDYLQVLAYMFRFDAKVGYYLYPSTGDDVGKKLWMNKGTSYDKVTQRDDICVVKHGLNIPLGVSSYDEFVEKIKVSEREFREGLVWKS